MGFNKEKYLKGKFLDMKLFDYDSNYTRNFIVPFEYAYRPDIICQRLYGDVSYQSLISYINRIDNSPEGYYSGRIIKIIKSEYIDSI